MAYRDPLTILNGSKTLLAALTWSGSPLFAEVKVYAREDLAAALRELYLFDDRLALIIPAGWSHRNSREGTDVHSRRTIEFVVLMTDRNFGGENTALIGESGENPGVLAMAQSVVAALGGQTLGYSADFVALLPTSGEVFRLSDPDREEAPGRDAWAQTFTTDAGEATFAVGRMERDTDA